MEDIKRINKLLKLKTKVNDLEPNQEMAKALHKHINDEISKIIKPESKGISIQNRDQNKNYLINISLQGLIGIIDIIKNNPPETRDAAELLATEIIRDYSPKVGRDTKE